MNSSSDLKYFHALSGRLLSAQHAIFPKNIRASDFSAYLANGCYCLRKPGSYELVCGLAAIPPKSRWIFDGSRVHYHSTIAYRNVSLSPTVTKIFDVAKRYMRVASGRRLAVELSGGFDTSLIIEVLEDLGSNFALLGFASRSYEFRTETFIQQLYSNRSPTSATLLNYQHHPAFADLLNTPVHPYPIVASMFHARHTAVANAALALGADTILNGDGADDLLTESFVDLVDEDVTTQYNRWTLADAWANETIYRPLNCSYVSPYSFSALSDQFISLRRHQGSDPMKLWARDFLKHYLPPQLSNYAYKAGHDGWIAIGLQLAAPDIRRLAQYAYRVTFHEDLEPDRVSELAGRFPFLDFSSRQHFLMCAAFSVWVYALARHKMLIN